MGAINIVKTINGGDGNSVLVGCPLTYTYVVTATAQYDDFTLVTVSDSPSQTISGPVKTGGNSNNFLEFGETWTYKATGTATSGTHTDTATASGYNSGGAWELDTDGSSYTGVSLTLTGPSAQTACVGATAIFSVTPSPTGTHTYQWQVNDGSGWQNVAGGSGGTTASYTTPTITAVMNGRQYRVVVTPSCGSAVTSNPATLTVNPTTSITIQPLDLTVCQGSSPSPAFTVVAVGAGLSYQWQQSTDGGLTWPTNVGTNTPTLSLTNVQPHTPAYRYHVVVTGSCGSATSNPATLTVNPTTSITTQPSDLTVCQGSSPSPAFTVVATGTGTLTYQWQQSTDGGLTWPTNVGTNSPTLSLINVQPHTPAYKYHVIVTGSCG
jgi:hypothetical protein